MTSDLIDYDIRRMGNDPMRVLRSKARALQLPARTVTHANRGTLMLAILRSKLGVAQLEVITHRDDIFGFTEME